MLPPPSIPPVILLLRLYTPKLFLRTVVLPLGLLKVAIIFVGRVRFVLDVLAEGGLGPCDKGRVRVRPGSNHGGLAATQCIH